MSRPRSDSVDSNASVDEFGRAKRKSSGGPRRSEDAGAGESARRPPHSDSENSSDESRSHSRFRNHRQEDDGSYSRRRSRSPGSSRSGYRSSDRRSRSPSYRLPRSSGSLSSYKSSSNRNDRYRSSYSSSSSRPGGYRYRNDPAPSYRGDREGKKYWEASTYLETEFYQNTIYLGDLPANTDEEQVRTIFSKVGIVKEVRLFTGKSYGFVTYETGQSVIDAIREFDNTSIAGPETNPIRVGRAKIPERNRNGLGNQPWYDVDAVYSGRVPEEPYQDDAQNIEDDDDARASTKNEDTDESDPFAIALKAYQDLSHGHRR
ncbi:uncharacterized protein BJ171DRAFT_475342 [Polychytrium aggregatum]|uniref:uncharacterized protein n=1 Tax=Polychytrium aggregatum TaxID=110093 RepID=UPI0022FE88B7|nr:uncharacterized protein BJ171DRAFT_475342 [Polychytrium aggregatum]KAI9203996.1 hypothetical protein BJ171DRAFT_475342 [Polychytrium aggregatum]